MPDDIPSLGERRYETRLTPEAGLEFITGKSPSWRRGAS